jgi:peroxiredoxin
MPALESGVRAPEFQLTSLDGNKFSLRDALKRGPAVLAFFKVSCPVCQLAFPYLERVFRAYSKTGTFTMVGVSQDNPADTAAFNKEYGVSFPVLLDEKGKYPVSNAYGLTIVPSIFLIGQDGEIESTTVGWSKADTLELNRKLAALSNLGPAQIFPSAENVPDFKPG